MKTIIVKIGGSLLHKTTIIDTLSEVLTSLNARIALIPGGGVFANKVRELFVRHEISSVEAHYMAIKAMEVYSILLASRIKNSRLCSSLEQARSAMDEGKIAIILPYKIISKTRVLPALWKITSDSIAVFLATLLKADFAILLKSVDGVFIDGKIVRELKAGRIRSLKGYADDYILELIRKYKVKVAIINGLKPEILRLIVQGEHCPYPYTVITA